MRLPVFLVAALLAAGAFAGCFGADGEPTQPAADGGDNGNLPTGGDGGALGTIKVLAALRTSISSEAPAWVVSGTSVDVAAAAPANAKGTVTYTWATGALPGTVEVTPVTLDTGSASTADYIGPGEEKSLKFTTAGVFEMHCHPHAAMRQNVTVIEGYNGPMTVHVNITDGKSLSDYRFVPERIVVGVGTTVVYHNAGEQAHTATLMTQEPPLKIAPLSEATGEVVVEGDGWQRIVVVTKDSDGRVGQTEHRVYVTPELPAFMPISKRFEFTAGGVPGVQPAPDEAESPQTLSFTMEQAGRIFLNLTGSDAASVTGAVTAAEFELHLVRQGDTQDSLTGDPDTDHELSTTIASGLYTLTVKATGGVQPIADVTIEVIYDLTPPMPEMAAPPSDGHGDHAGH